MRSGSHTVTSLSERTRNLYLSNHYTVRPLLEFPSIRLLSILHVDIPCILHSGDGKVGQSMPVTLYLTISVSPKLAPPILPNNPPNIPTEGFNSPTEEATEASMTPDSGGPIQSTVPDLLLSPPRHLPVETGTTTPHDQAEMLPTEDPLITLRHADEAMKLIDRSNTWESAVGRIKWVMDMLGPIAEVRVISFCLSFTEPTFTLSFPLMPIWHVVYFQRSQRCIRLRHCRNERLCYVYLDGRHS